MNSSSESLFHHADTYESLLKIPGISFKKWSYDKARVKTFCELVYARKLVKARKIEFLGGKTATKTGKGKKKKEIGQESSGKVHRYSKRAIEEEKILSEETKYKFTSAFVRSS